jgi:phosphatidylglycerophosphate synthase
MTTPILTATDATTVWRQVPNVLTVFRIFLVPLLV